MPRVFVARGAGKAKQGKVLSKLPRYLHGAPCCLPGADCLGKL